MAVRKAKIKARLDSVVSGMLEPGEQVVASTYAQSGPSPWLAGLIGIWIMLLMGTRPYFVVVTDRRVLFVRSSFWMITPR